LSKKENASSKNIVKRGGKVQYSRRRKSTSKNEQKYTKMLKYKKYKKEKERYNLVVSEDKRTELYNKRAFA